MKIGPAVQLAVLALAILGLIFQRRDSRRRFYDFGFGTVISTVLLVSPLSWNHHYVFLIPALACFASLLSSNQLKQESWIAALLLLTIAIALEWPLLIAANNIAQALIATLPTIGPLGLFCMFAVWSLTQPRNYSLQAIARPSLKRDVVMTNPEG